MAAEKNFENKVKKHLASKGCWTLKTWSNGVQRAGVPDLLVCCNGYFVGVELKAQNGEPSKLQLYNLKKIHESGGFGLILYPNEFDIFCEMIEAILDGNIELANNIYDDEFYSGGIMEYF